MTRPYCCFQTPSFSLTSGDIRNIPFRDEGRLFVAKTNPLTFLQQVRSEVAKVVWPSRRETVVTTIMTLILVFLTAVFFFLVDQVLSYGTGFLFG